MLLSSATGTSALNGKVILRGDFAACAARQAQVMFIFRPEKDALCMLPNIDINIDAHPQNAEYVHGYLYNIALT